MSIFENTEEKMTNVVDLNAKRCERDVGEYLEAVGRSELAVQLLAQRLTPIDFERFTNLIRGTGGHFFDAVFGEWDVGGEFWSGRPDDNGPLQCLACDALLPEDRIDSVCAAGGRTGEGRQD
jgi:hypothetical protein